MHAFRTDTIDMFCRFGRGRTGARLLFDYPSCMRRTRLEVRAWLPGPLGLRRRGRQEKDLRSPDGAASGRNRRNNSAAVPELLTVAFYMFVVDGPPTPGAQPPATELLAASAVIAAADAAESSWVETKFGVWILLRAVPLGELRSDISTAASHKSIATTSAGATGSVPSEATESAASTDGDDESEFPIWAIVVTVLLCTLLLAMLVIVGVSVLRPRKQGEEGAASIDAFNKWLETQQQLAGNPAAKQLARSRPSVSEIDVDSGSAHFYPAGETKPPIAGGPQGQGGSGPTAVRSSLTVSEPGPGRGQSTSLETFTEEQVTLANQKIVELASIMQAPGGVVSTPAVSALSSAASRPESIDQPYLMVGAEVSSPAPEPRGAIGSGRDGQGKLAGQSLSSAVPPPPAVVAASSPEDGTKFGFSDNEDESDVSDIESTTNTGAAPALAPASPPAAAAAAPVRTGGTATTSRAQFDVVLSRTSLDEHYGFSIRSDPPDALSDPYDGAFEYHVEEPAWSHVVSVVTDSGLAKGSVHVGDAVLAINSTPLAALDGDQVINLIDPTQSLGVCLTLAR